jgi:hypothetical protein
MSSAATTLRTGPSISRLNCCRSSPAQEFLLSNPVVAHDHILLFRTFTCFEMGPPLQRGEGSDYNSHSPSTMGDSSLSSPPPPHTHTHSLPACRPVHQVKYCLPSPAQSFLISNPVETHDLIYLRSKTAYVIGNRVSFSTIRGVCLPQ